VPLVRRVDGCSQGLVEVSVNGNEQTKAHWYETEPTPMESTASVGTASLAAGL
jgi:hypothetical protein